MAMLGNQYKLEIVRDNANQKRRTLREKARRKQILKDEDGQIDSMIEFAFAYSELGWKARKVLGILLVYGHEEFIVENVLDGNDKEAATAHEMLDELGAEYVNVVLKQIQETMEGLNGYLDAEIKSYFIEMEKLQEQHARGELQD